MRPKPSPNQLVLLRFTMRLELPGSVRPVRSAARTFATALIAVVMSHQAANAISLTNRDTREHKVSITESSGKTDRMLKPNEAVADICVKGCIVRLNDSENDEYELEGDEVVSIEDGYLYYDGPEAPSAPPAGAAAPGSPGSGTPPSAPAKPN